MISISDLNYSHNGHEIIKNLTIDFHDGEVIGLIGMPGCGKTLFLKHLSGCFKKSRSAICLEEKDLSSYKKRDLNKMISLFNGSTPNNMDDILSNFLLLSRAPFKNFFKPFTGYDLEVVSRYLTHFKLEDFKESSLSSLPASRLKMSLLAFSFIREANVMLLDNPTSDLDIESKSLLGKTISKNVMDGDKIIIIASHDLNFISQVCDRVIVMNDGMIVRDGDPDIIDADLIKEFFNAEVFVSRNIYNGRPEIHLFPNN